MTSRYHAALAATLLSIVTPTLAFAHTGLGDAHGFTQGFLHPVGGLDHVLAMVTVGLLAATLGGRALWLLPASFVAVMALGGALGSAGVNVPFVETGIALSVVIFGLAVAFRTPLPVLAGMALVGFFAIFHGWAHGAEMPTNASGLAYAGGFLLATALVHGVGIAVGLGTGQLGGTFGARLAQAGGGAMTLAGLAILTKLI
jgi:urease accessory protein